MDEAVTKPLRVFYFVGPVWHNMTPTEICHSLTGVDASWWAATPDRLLQCEELLARHFVSFDATVVYTAYFALVGLAVGTLVCRFCCIRPAVSELRRVMSPFARRREVVPPSPVENSERRRKMGTAAKDR
jgi:hypothetical protein